jgi:hypothetical protein
MHVVWRGNRLPDDVAAIARTATGHAGKTQHDTRGDR